MSTPIEAQTFTTAAGLDFGVRAVPRAHFHDPTAGHCAHCSERGYIMRSMVLGLRRAPLYRDMTEREFAPYARELERRLDDPTMTALVAYDPYDPWLVMGFVLGEPGILTYLQVRGGCRNMGLATELASALGIARGTRWVAEFPTHEIVRERPGRTLPIGIAHNPNWSVAVRPWHPDNT